MEIEITERELAAIYIVSGRTSSTTPIGRELGNLFDKIYNAVDRHWTAGNDLYFPPDAPYCIEFTNEPLDSNRILGVIN